MRNKYSRCLLVLLTIAIFTSNVSAQKLKMIPLLGYDYELPAIVELPEGYKNYSATIQADFDLVTPSRIAFLRDSTKRLRVSDKERQSIFQQVLSRDNAIVAAQIADEKFNFGAYTFRKSDEGIDFAIQVHVGALQYETIEHSDSDTVLTMSYEAEVKVVDAHTNQVLYRQSIQDNPDDLIVTKPMMVVLFTPKELLKLKFKKRDTELKKSIYDNAVNRHNSTIFQNAVDSAASVVDYQILPLRETHFPLFSAKRKFDYDKLEKAVEIMKEISKVRKTRLFSSKHEMSREEEISKLHEAIAIWEEELATEDATDEDARINAIIAEGLRYNCTLAYILMRDFDKANEYVQQLDTKLPVLISKPEHRLPEFALELEYLIAEAALRLDSKE